MNNLVRCLSEDGTVLVMAADTTELVETARRYHETSKVCSAALGRLLTAASLMGTLLKSDDYSLTLRINGGGPAGSVIAVGDPHGNVRGYVMDAAVELPLNEKGKLDVGGAVGTDGHLTVIKDIGMRDPYIGQIPIVSGEIAEDITSYYAISEQIPTVCALGVLVNPDLSIAAAGGFMIQLLPTADDTIIDHVEAGLQGLPSVTEMLTQGMTPLEICKKVVPNFEIGVLDEEHPEYVCNCSKDRVEAALLSTGRESLLEMAQDAGTQVRCHFCPKIYTFTPEELLQLAGESAESESEDE